MNRFNELRELIKTVMIELGIRKSVWSKIIEIDLLDLLMDDITEPCLFSSDTVAYAKEALHDAIVRYMNGETGIGNVDCQLRALIAKMTETHSTGCKIRPLIDYISTYTENISYCSFPASCNACSYFITDKVYGMHPNLPAGYIHFGKSWCQTCIELTSGRFNQSGGPDDGVFPPHDLSLMPHDEPLRQKRRRFHDEDD